MAVAITIVVIVFLTEQKTLHYGEVNSVSGLMTVAITSAGGSLVADVLNVTVAARGPAFTSVLVVLITVIVCDGDPSIP